uniref:Uncharacterized protein n=1 Tax=Anopheles coluzzii TaxID=1518534 RepID=A0A8W7PE09_ANOCL
MVHLYQTTTAPQPSPKTVTKPASFMASLKGLFFRTNQSKPSPEGPNTRPKSLWTRSSAPQAPIASPESGSEPSSLVLPRVPEAPIQPLTVHRTVTIQLPHHGDNRYDIRSETGGKDQRRAKAAIKPVKRRSFGKRINNLWSNFGLLRSSEKIVEFANGHGESEGASELCDVTDARTVSDGRPAFSSAYTKFVRPRGHDPQLTIVRGRASIVHACRCRFRLARALRGGKPTTTTTTFAATVPTGSSVSNHLRQTFVTLGMNVQNAAGISGSRSVVTCASN